MYIRNADFSQAEDGVSEYGLLLVPNAVHRRGFGTGPNYETLLKRRKRAAAVAAGVSFRLRRDAALRFLVVGNFALNHWKPDWETGR